MRTRSDGAAASQLDLTLARAVMYHALAASLRRPDSRERGRLFSFAGREALLVAAALLDLEPPASEPLRPLAETWSLLGADRHERFCEAHDRLFGHSRGLACAFETEYGGLSAFDQPQTLADIAGCYQAFGLLARGSRDERVDHVACECEFLCFLARKEAFLWCAAQAAGDESGAAAAAEQLEIARAAARGFLRQHLGRFGRAFASQLVTQDPAGFFGALGRVLCAFLTQECRRFGVAAGPASLALRPPVPDDAPLACGSLASCDVATQRIPVRRRT
jgi:TorA maturation chaperone TorD